MSAIVKISQTETPEAPEEVLELVTMLCVGVSAQPSIGGVGAAVTVSLPTDCPLEDIYATFAAAFHGMLKICQYGADALDQIKRLSGMFAVLGDVLKEAAGTEVAVNLLRACIESVKGEEPEE